MQGERVRGGTGADTWVRVAVWISVALCANLLFAPWFSLPELEYQGLDGNFTLWNVEQSVGLAQRLYLVVNPQVLQLDETTWGLIWATRVSAAVAAVGMLVCAGWMVVGKKRATWPGRMAAVVSLLPVMGAVGVWIRMNEMVNASMGVENTFWTSTAFSHMQLTGFACMHAVASVLLMAGVGKMLDTQRLEYGASPMTRHGRGKRTRLAAVIILCGIPLLIAFGLVFLKGRSYYFISLCIILLAMLPFAAAFEDRTPQAREIVLIASLVVIATAGRAVFFMLPHFKPVTALVIVAGIGVGAEAGFLTGAMTGFVSNFLFGQGPWTPWQMFAFGIIGFLAGLLFSKAEERGRVNLGLVCVFGGLATLVIYGGIMDTCTALSVLEGLTWESMLACYVAGVPVNMTHSIATVLFLALDAKPMLKKIRRLRKKYGMLPTES